MRILYIPLKAEYFDAIKRGDKKEEYRIVNSYWDKRLLDRNYDKIVLTKGYPKANDNEKRLEKPYKGWKTKTIVHPHFNNIPTFVYAIDVS